MDCDVILKATKVDGALAIGVLFFCGVSRGESLELEWARTYRVDPSKFNQALKVVKVADGIVVGGTGSGSAGDSDYVVVKYEANGEEAWVRSYNGGAGSNDVLRDIGVDPNGNVFVTGTSHTVKYDQNGLLIWTNTLGGRAIVANADFVYITGFSEVDFATAQLANKSLDGHQNWVRTYDGVAHDVDLSLKLQLTAQGDAFVGGSEAVVVMKPYYGLSFTVLKYDSAGGETKVGSTRNPPTDFSNYEFAVRSMAIDGLGYVYFYGTRGGHRLFDCLDPAGAVVALSVSGYGDLGEMALVRDGAAVIVREKQLVRNGPLHAYVGVLQTNAAIVWEKTFSSGYPGDSAAKGVVVNSAGIYATGYTPGAAGDRDLFVVGYTTNGVPLGSIIYDSGSNKSDFGTSITSDDAGNLYVTGYSTTVEGGSELLTLKFHQGPGIKDQPPGAMHLRFQTSANQRYRIEATTNLLSWHNLVTTTADANGLVLFDDTNAPAIPYRFYRGSAAP